MVRLVIVVLIVGRRMLILAVYLVMTIFVMILSSYRLGIGGVVM